MTFTYNLVPPYTDLTRIRFHTGDTDATAPIWADEEIAFVQSEVGSYQVCVISLLQNLIAKLTQERQFTADWLTTSPALALESIKALMEQKRLLFGIPLITGTALAPYRPDSGSSASPDYTGLEQGDYSLYNPDAGSLGGYGW